MRGRPHNRMVPLFDTDYWTWAGTLCVTTDEYVILIRIRDGLCKRFTWEQLGFRDEGPKEKAQGIQGV